jgi:hypothetical protein
MVMSHEYRTYVQAWQCKQYIFMCPRNQDNKCTCISSSAGSNLLRSAHIMTRISVL